MTKRLNSRAKGQRGERLFRDFLRDTYNDVDAKRGQQVKGTEDSPDVDSPMLHYLLIHPEVKWYEECQLMSTGIMAAWLEKAGQDASPKYLPVVFHRWNRSIWWAAYLLPSGRTQIMTAEEFLDEQLEYRRAAGVSEDAEVLRSGTTFVPAS